MSQHYYTKYDPNTGEITEIGGCSAVKLATMTDYVEGQFDPATYHVVNGEAVLKDQADIDAQQLVIDEANSKNKRNALLADSDKYMLSDFPTTLQAEWGTYRQQLRDLTDDPNWPDPTWPTPPE